MITYKIGREQDNQIVLPQDDRLSRYHATFEIHDDGSMVLKDHSKNGTNVNGYTLHNNSMPVQRGAAIMFAGVARLDWNIISSGRKKEPVVLRRKQPSLVWLWVSLPVLALIMGLLYSYRCKIFDIDCGPVPGPGTGAGPIAVRVSKHYDKSVGLIFHAYYYKRKVAGGTMFIGFEKAGYESGRRKLGYAFSQEDLMPFVSSGTGFLVNGKEGNLITNRHVADPGWVATNESDQLDGDIKNYINDLKNFIYNVETKILKMAPSQVTLETHTSLLRFLPTGTDMSIQDDASNSEILSRVSSRGFEAIPVLCHNESKVDLALLRVSEIDTSRYSLINPGTEIKYSLDSLIGTPVVLLGYSGGLFVGYNNQKKTVSRTIESGYITNDPSNFMIQYGIDTEGGSSGSPVFNNDEKLIAVHYAGRGNNGFGIPAKYIKDLLSHTNVRDLNN